jgi:hypothetical protein
MHCTHTSHANYVVVFIIDQRHSEHVNTTQGSLIMKFTDYILERSVWFNSCVSGIDSLAHTVARDLLWSRSKEYNDRYNNLLRIVRRYE